MKVLLKFPKINLHPRAVRLEHFKVSGGSCQRIEKQERLELSKLSFEKIWKISPALTRIKTGKNIPNLKHSEKKGICFPRRVQRILRPDLISVLPCSHEGREGRPVLLVGTIRISRLPGGGGGRLGGVEGEEGVVGVLQTGQRLGVEGPAAEELEVGLQR